MVNLSQFDPSKLGTNETLSLLAEVERSLAKIRENAGDEAARAEEAARLAREMKALEDERARLLERVIVLESQVATSTSAAAALESQLGAARGSAKDLESQLGASRDESKRLGDELAQLKKAGEALAADGRALKSRIGLLETQLGEARKAKQSTDSELDAARKAQKSTDAELAKSQKSIERLEGEAAKAKDAVKALESELAKAKDAAKSLDAELGESRNATSRLEKQLGESKARVSALEGELAAAQKKAIGFEKNIKELRASVESLESQVAAARAQSTGFEKQLGESKAAFEKVRAELAEARAAATETKKALDAAKTDAKRFGDELAQANAAREKADAERERAESELNEAAGFTKQFASEIAALKSTAKRLEKELGESKSAAARLEGEVGEAKSASAKLEQELAQAKTSASKASAELAAARNSASNGDGELRAARQAITTLESEVATARRTVDELRKQSDAARAGVASLEAALKKAESERSDAEELARMAEQECTRIAGEAKSAREALQHDHARALEQAQATARGAFDGERARIQSLEKERDDAFARLKSAETRIGQITSLADSQAEQILGLEQQIADARAALDELRADAGTAHGGGPSLAEIETLAEQRVTALLQPKLEQLAQAASFLRIRRERLTALRLGLKRKSKTLKAMARTPANPAGSVAPSSNEAIESERTELARERQEILDLRVMLHASEESVARRAAGNRFLTLATLCSAMLGLAALCAWHVSGAVVSPPVLATVDLEVSSRMQDNRFELKSEPKPDAGATAQADGAVGPNPSGEVAAPAEPAALAAPIASLIKERISDPVWAGLVSARLAERGRTRAESDALVQDLANRVSVAAEGGSVHLSLRGEGELATRTTLDAIAMTAVNEANRDPARRADYLRVGIANAKQEVGRTVFSVADTLPDPQRWGRAGAILGMTTLVAVGLVGIAMALSRRPHKPAEVPTAAL